MAEEEKWFAGTPITKTMGSHMAADTEAYAGRVSKARRTDQAVRGIRDKSGQQGKRCHLASE